MTIIVEIIVDKRFFYESQEYLEQFFQFFRKVINFQKIFYSGFTCRYSYIFIKKSENHREDERFVDSNNYPSSFLFLFFKSLEKSSPTVLFTCLHLLWTNI